MLRSAKGLRGYTVRASDGPIGKVHDVYFDDSTWTARYLVVDTGGWLSGRQVLLSPASCGVPDSEQKLVPVALTREQVENSPPVEADRPVSRQHEIELAAYYGWPDYWIGDPGFGPGAVYVPASAGAAEAAQRTKGDPHLRSTREVQGYHIQAPDGEIGHVEDFLIEDGAWAIRYLVVDTRNWLPGKRVLIAPQWVKEVNWAEMKVLVEVPRAAIRHSPAYDPSAPVTRDYESKLHEHYGRSKYWE